MINHDFQRVYVLILFLLTTACTPDRKVDAPAWYTPEELQIIQRSLDLPEHLISYQVSLAPHMEFEGMMPPDISNAKALLGRVLFYDPKLSRNEKVSCASCHQQRLAFSDEVARSKNFQGGLTKRNTLALGAAANFSSSYGTEDPAFLAAKNPDITGSLGFFWDERAGSIVEQSRQTISDEAEMGMNLEELAQKLTLVDYYQVLFLKAYGTTQVEESHILEALEEFVNAIASHDTPFDRGLTRHRTPLADFNNFTDLENAGKRIFMTNCASCHGSDMTTPAAFTAHNGLVILNDDLGVGDISGLPADAGQFKVPFLRNIAVTGPYMHDGRFSTLEAVVDHYSQGIQMHPNLAASLRDPDNTEMPLRLHFTEEEKAALVAFLHTLTDEQLIHDERLADPFRK